MGERGTAFHAIVLGLVTTITHTGAVIVLAALLLFLFPKAVPAELQMMLGFVGGLLITGMGLWLLLRRLGGGADHVHLGGGHHHHHGHHHHDHAHADATSPDKKVSWMPNLWELPAHRPCRCHFNARFRHIGPAAWLRCLLLTFAPVWPAFWLSSDLRLSI